MKKYIIFIIVLLIVTIGVVSGFKFYKNGNSKIITDIDGCIADCGKGGWEKMKEKCDQTIASKKDAYNCFINFSWIADTLNNDSNKIKEGYIEIGEYGLLENSTTKSIKVFNFNQWAIDKNGNMYLMGQLG